MLRTTLLILLWFGAAFPATQLEEEIAQWRRARISALTADGGWLTVTGRFRLNEGLNRFGTAASNEIVLPDGPPHAGSVKLDGDRIIVETAGEHRSIAPNSGEAFRVGRLSLSVYGRAGDYSVRMKDPDSQIRRKFHGVDYFPVGEGYRVNARFVANPRKIGGSSSPGYVVFQMLGRELRLYPVLEQPNAKVLLIIFRDRTTGRETYAGGRFLDVEPPHEGAVVLDFNKAYNPPCAFTPHVSCPLPPGQNRLPVRVEAGEKNYAH